jgi:formate hydrogenlyase subunit 4
MPYVLFTSTLMAGLMMPLVNVSAPLSLFGGALAFVGLLALGRFFLALGGLDPASAFGGMGSSREMTIAAVAEPALMLAIFTVAITAGSTNLSQMLMAAQGPTWKLLNPAHVLAFAALFIVLLAETGRIPVDNPATHLELTMIHEAMILEYSGRHLALIEWASCLKLFAYSCLGIALFFPFGISEAADPASLAVAGFMLIIKLALGGFLLALSETLSAKMRIFRAPEFLGTAFLLAVLAMLVHLLLESGL